ncbi:hypothetical protein CBF34_09355 [Vagococcus penaei]|uniref:Uncharacterized protein n=1 Tax=Vagococcus penaei TaxID=633807 RepID=A0A1Q2D5M5_9ENTE|nr:hypothetical protein BW732_05125 [Vagococcus penaei]RST99259.1 hypothetical protein CBF34_09355 [Vagococcus penaei]
MYQLLIFIPALILLLIGWYISKHQTTLLTLFTQNNQKTLKSVYQSFFILGLIGLPLGFFFPSRIIALTYVIIILVISASVGYRLAKNWS